MSAFSLPRAADRYLVPWTRMDWPVPWNARFGRSAPLRLELGFGNGEFLEEAAARRPDVNWVGAELSWVSVVRLLRRLHPGGAENVRVLHGDGAFLLERLFAPGTLEEIVANHSDPWPKKRHASRRLVQPRFVEVAASRLVRGGRLVLVTDHPSYAAWITDVLQGQDHLRSAYPGPWVDRLPGHHRTKYQRQGLAAGATIHHFVWVRTGTDPPPHHHPEKVEAMTNVLLEGEYVFDRLLAGIRGKEFRDTHRKDPVVIRFGAPYLREDGGEWTVDARISEGPFSQHVLFTVEERAGERLLLKPSPVGSPRPTWGVRRALRRLAEHLLSAQPGLRVHSSGVEGLGPVTRASRR